MKKNIFDRLGIDLNTLSKEGKGFFRGFISEYSKNVDRFNDPATQKYFNNLIAVIMLEFHDSYENSDIRTLYRIKSPKSVLDKIINYLSRDDKSDYEVNQFGEPQGRLKEELSDMFAMTIVGCSRPPIFYSSDPEIQKLIKEQNNNHEILGEMQKYKSRLTGSDFSSGTKRSYKFDYKEGQEVLTREEYYVYCMSLIERIKSLIDPNAKKLIKKYDDMLENIRTNLSEEFISLAEPFIFDEEPSYPRTTFDKKQIVSQISTSHIYKKVENYEVLTEMKKGITSKDVEVVDFLDLIDDFSARIHDKLDLVVLRKQIEATFENSELLKQFGVKIIPNSLKKKRTEDGYVSDFLYLETPFGKIEMQLQTQHENQEGSYGYAAHCDMEGKNFKEFDIPDPNDEQQLKDFRTCVEFISAKKFIAQFDNSEKDRVFIQVLGKYQNYKAIMMQVKEGSEKEQRLIEYFAQLYGSRNEIFPGEAEQERIESFVDYDIQEYLRSEEFKSIIKKVDDKEPDR